MLSRFWYFVLAALCAAAISAAYLVHAAMTRRSAELVDEALRRDRFEVELWLSVDEHSRIDAIGPMTTNGDVKAVLAEASAHPAGTSIQAGSKQRLEATLGQLNRQLAAGAADVLVAVDARGGIVCQIGGGSAALDASLRDLEFVRTSLQGQSAAAIWMRDGTPLRATARPVLGNNGVVGAIVHAMEIDDELATHLIDRVEGSSIAFFMGDRVIASAAGPGSGDTTSKEVLEGSLATARRDPQLASQGRVGPMDLPTTAEAIYALFPGKPADGQLGFVVARSPHVTSSPFEILKAAPADDVGKLPWAVVIGVPVAFALLGLLLLFLERDKPLAAFHAALRKLADGTLTQMPSGELKANFRIMAEDINAGLERAHHTGAGPGVGAHSLDALLEAAPAAASSASYYAVPGSIPPPRGSVPPPRASVPPPRMSVPQPAPVIPAAPPAAPPAPPAPPPAPPAPPAAAPPPPPAPPTPRVTAPPAAAPAEPPAPAPEESSAPADSATQNTTPTTPPPAAPPQSAYDDEDEGATTVAQIPAELLNTMQKDVEDEEKHFRDTFAEYVRIREQCGESTKGLTYEKFEVTLRKTKEQIVQRHGGSRVRFSVYVKEGKAALKAAPK